MGTHLTGDYAQSEKRGVAKNAIDTELIFPIDVTAI